MAIVPFKIGVRTVIRYMRHDGVSEGWIAKHAGKKIGYIWILGVADSQRGKGYCRILIDKAIEEMKAQGLDEFWLKTEDPKNVLFYQKLGFKVMHETLVECSGLKSWVMKKK
jgi:ribosomal protein S18 acetylase RimI-like enzyme